MASEVPKMAGNKLTVIFCELQGPKLSMDGRKWGFLECVCRDTNSEACSRENPSTVFGQKDFSGPIFAAKGQSPDCVALRYPPSLLSLCMMTINVPSMQQFCLSWQTDYCLWGDSTHPKSNCNCHLPGQRQMKLKSWSWQSLRWLSWNPQKDGKEVITIPVEF